MVEFRVLQQGAHSERRGRLGKSSHGKGSWRNGRDSVAGVAGIAGVIAGALTLPARSRPEPRTGGDGDVARRRRDILARKIRTHAGQFTIAPTPRLNPVRAAPEGPNGSLGGDNRRMTATSSRS